ncbi:hypothetical protein GGR26_001644 [Lewinella marina]|uniref:Uncharacterized protein n=1 Tax=Neolewinella marina TaxID=438751 RepID=A0A2G0CAX1_9BACT|nr:hypothetical protein [Neolewinella marina]NJB85876.1 hypothetical protein [Neolewinella marina]PHK97114.1 hypothetical protein CGL56_17700 [Neolewinella marina]
MHDSPPTADRRTELPDPLDLVLDTQNAYSAESLAAAGYDPDTIQKVQYIRLQLQQHLTLQQEQVRKQQQFMEESATDTFALIKSLKDSLNLTLHESKHTQWVAKTMYVLTYALGFGLICVAVYFGTLGEEILSVTFGTFGMASIVGLMLSDPPLKLQDSRSNYTQLTVGVLAWFTDLIDKQAMTQNIQANLISIQQQASDIPGLVKAQESVLQQYMTLSNAQIDNTARVLRLLEEVAEPSNRPIGKKRSLKKRKSARLARRS